MQYEQSIADMLQKQSLRLDESQEIEGQQLRDRLQYELEILTAYQSKNRMNAQTQRDRERKQLDDRVSVRRALLENKVRERNGPCGNEGCMLLTLLVAVVRWRPSCSSSRANGPIAFDTCTTSTNAKRRRSTKSHWRRA